MDGDKIFLTEDGSHSIISGKFGVTYHSKHGALQESAHVFIRHGLTAIIHQGKKNIRILEVGFGTGSNALLSLIEGKNKQVNIDYTALEAFPITNQLVSQLNYTDQLQVENLAKQFESMHAAPWNQSIHISESFQLHKHQIPFQDFRAHFQYDLIYYDAFGPGEQPELWTTEALAPFIEAMAPGGMLTTYCAKGSVRRSLIALGCEVERLPGPPGKREMLRALRI